jgi:starch-binding outer membrane protein, SusD/RagB family
MKKNINFILLVLILSFSACEDYLEPLPVGGQLDDEDLFANPSFAEGLLMKAYKDLPSNYTFETDIASDDAVTNVKGSPYKLMATGGWQATFNPISRWNDAYEKIFYINYFLENFESILWANDPTLSDAERERENNLHKKRAKGEAHGLRAWYQFQLLQNHAGFSNDGRLLGFVILKEPLELPDDWKLPRNTFSDCVDAIMEDLDIAIDNLPAVYKERSDGIENKTIGSRFENRMDGRAAMALKSRVALLAASPAYSAANVISWEQVAVISGDLLSELSPLYANGVEFYKEVRNDEIIWNLAQEQMRSWEINNFPPSLFGRGNTNPSQNLVDAFPMKNGYPINEQSSGFDPDDPYTNRDPRLSKYIIYNGAKLKNQPINTFVGAELDGINVLETSTRTGYYLKKFMSEGVNLQPGRESNATHTYTLLRATEVLLNFAEAANEAWGPDGDPQGYGFTARSKIEELRNRAGITQPDEYLASLDGNGLRELIRNERRLELCFEDFRFWDLRRWKDTETISDDVNGVFINMENVPDYTYTQVEERKYSPDMIYGPIPYEETKKYNIEQNKGW